MAKPLIATAILYLLALPALTSERVPDWLTSRTLWTAATNTKQTPRAWVNRANAELVARDQDAGLISLAAADQAVRAEYRKGQIGREMAFAIAVNVAFARQQVLMDRGDQAGAAAVMAQLIEDWPGGVLQVGGVASGGGKP